MNTSEDSHSSHILRAIQSTEFLNEKFSSLYEFDAVHATKVPEVRYWSDGPGINSRWCH
jgi:hypothetical protein